MSPHPSPLADTVASLRIATLALPARAWVPQAIHALILACLARIFGRLEEMIRLWQAGLLPPPIQRPSTPRTPSRHPGLRDARQDPDSVHYLAHYVAARSATAMPARPIAQRMKQAFPWRRRGGEKQTRRSQPASCCLETTSH